MTMTGWDGHSPLRAACICSQLGAAVPDFVVWLQHGSPRTGRPRTQAIPSTCAQREKAPKRQEVTGLFLAVHHKLAIENQDAVRGRPFFP